MALENITNKILNDAKLDAEAILKEAKDKVSAIENEANIECEKIKNDFATRFKDEEAEIYKKTAIVGKLDIAKIQLQGRRDLIAATNALALQKLQSLSESDYISFVVKLLDKIDSDGTIMLGNNEKYLTSAWLSNYCEQKGKNINISEQKGNFNGGFVFHTENKAYDLSFEMLLKNYNEKCESTVVKHLFDSLQAVK